MPAWMASGCTGTARAIQVRPKKKGQGTAPRPAQPNFWMVHTRSGRKPLLRVALAAILAARCRELSGIFGGYTSRFGWNGARQPLRLANATTIAGLGGSASLNWVAFEPFLASFLERRNAVWEMGPVS